MDVVKIDKNFAINTTIDLEGLVFFDAQELPFKIYGVIYEGGMFRRMPEAVAKDVNPGVYALHTCTTGGRVKFVTDSPYIAISAEMNSMAKLPHYRKPAERDPFIINACVFANQSLHVQ